MCVKGELHERVRHKRCVVSILRVRRGLFMLYTDISSWVRHNVGDDVGHII